MTSASEIGYGNGATGPEWSGTDTASTWRPVQGAIE